MSDGSASVPQATADYPLAGLRVIDCTEYLSGPYCTVILASLGADVIKVERLAGDAHRKRTPRVDGEPIPFHMSQHNKRSLAIDLKSEPGRQALLSLIRGADVFVQNFRPGVVERLGLDYAAAKRVRPDIIYCSISGFGREPPYGGMAGVDLVAQAMGGLMSVTGETDGPPVRPGYPVGDMGAGMWAAIGILAAHVRRTRTGLGDAVDVSLFDGMVAWSIWPMSEYLMTGVNPRRIGSAHQFMAPYECFECADGTLIAICGGSDEHWPLLCHMLEMTELMNDPRMVTAYTRYEHREELRRIIAPVVLRRSSREWLDELRSAGIPGGPLLTMADLAHDEHVRRNGMIVSTGGFRDRVDIVGNPIRFADSRKPPIVRAPAVGEQSREILTEAGLESSEISLLEERQVVRTTTLQSPD
jgi:CoA:oxalate CoA-transferase